MMIQDKFISLEGKVAIITGAGQGIGLAIAQLYAKYGAAVAMVDVSDKCAEEAGKIRELGAEAQAFKCDVTSEDGVKKTVEAVMHACGLSKAVLVKAAMILALFTGIVAAVNVMWAGPMSSRHQDEVLAEAKANPGMAALAQGQFQQATDGNSVLFIESVDGSKFNDVFLAQLRPKGNARPSVVVADSGQLAQSKDGSQIVKLNKGTRFEGTAMLRDFRITDFQNYQAIIGHQAVALDPTDTEQMDMRTLWNTDTDRARAEFHWRITLVFTVFMMALIVVPLSVVNPRQGRVLSMLPAMLLYLIYFLLQTSIRSNGAKGKLDPMVWTWFVNSLYILLALGLNLWDTVPVRRIRARFSRKGAI